MSLIFISFKDILNFPQTCCIIYIPVYILFLVRIFAVIQNISAKNMNQIKNKCRNTTIQGDRK